MSVIAKSLGKWFTKPVEPSEKELLIDFIGDLDSVLESMEDLAADMFEGFNSQILQQRSVYSKLIALLPNFLQPTEIRVQTKRRNELNSTKLKMMYLRKTLNEIGSSIKQKEFSAKSSSEINFGQQIYELAYPGERINTHKVGTLEERLQILENSFLTSMDKVNDQLNDISHNLKTLKDRLDEQNVKIDRIDNKISEVDSKLKKIQSSLVNISRKLTQNRTLLALLAGSVIALIIVIIII